MKCYKKKIETIRLQKTEWKRNSSCNWTSKFKFSFRGLEKMGWGGKTLQNQDQYSEDVILLLCTLA